MEELIRPPLPTGVDAPLLAPPWWQWGVASWLSLGGYDSDWTFRSPSCSCYNKPGVGFTRENLRPSKHLLHYSRSEAFVAYHFLPPADDVEGEYRPRNMDRTVSAGTVLHASAVSLCEQGLHASLTPRQARNYGYSGDVLTEVLVWGGVRFGATKLVASNRLILRALPCTPKQGDES